jgi:hypothetical protein
MPEFFDGGGNDMSAAAHVIYRFPRAASTAHAIYLMLLYSMACSTIAA